MDYPEDFPAESRAKVEAARIRAGRQFDSKRPKAKWYSDIEALFWTYVLTPFLVFAGESARLRLWPADKMDWNCREFLRRCTIAAYYQKGIAAGLSDMISNLNGRILWEAQQEIDKTSQWRKYENILLKFAVKGSATTQSSAQNNGQTAQSVGSKSTAPGRREMVDTYIAEVLAKTGEKISRKDFWLVAGYDNPTQFERFQRSDLRTTQSAATNFHRVLNMKPEDFIRSLQTRKATKNAQPKRAR